MIIKLKIEGQTKKQKPHVGKLQNSNQNLTLSWVSIIGLQELRFYCDLNLYIISDVVHGKVVLALDLILVLKSKVSYFFCGTTINKVSFLGECI